MDSNNWSRDMQNFLGLVPNFLLEDSFDNSSQKRNKRCARLSLSLSVFSRKRSLWRGLLSSSSSALERLGKLLSDLYLGQGFRFVLSLGIGLSFLSLILPAQKGEEEKEKGTPKILLFGWRAGGNRLSRGKRRAAIVSACDEVARKNFGKERRGEGVTF